MGSGDEQLRAAAREHLLAEHRDLLAATLDCADRVAGAAHEDGARRALADCLRERGLLGRFPGALSSAVAAAGYEMPAAPAPAPPYVVVTDAGVLLRATLPPGRLVATIEAFAVERDPRRYVRAEDSPEAALRVEVR